MSFRKDADVAQVVAHLIGNEEVTGPSPVISSTKNPLKIVEFIRDSIIFKGFLAFLPVPY